VEGVQAQHGLGATAGDRVGDPGGRIRADRLELARALLAEASKKRPSVAWSWPGAAQTSRPLSWSTTT
jgi:hypothetical protein